MLLVWVNLTLTCQGHDVGQHHTGVHIAIFGDHDEDHGVDRSEIEQSGQPAHAQEIDYSNSSVHTTHKSEMGDAASSPASSIEGEPTTARGCMIGPSSGTPEGGDIGTIGAGDKEVVATQIPPLTLHVPACDMPLFAQAFTLPEEPPPRNLV